MTLFGAEPVAVESAVATRQPSAGLGDLDDTFAVVLRMPGDKLASFTVSYAMNNVDSLIVAGMKGSIHMSPAYGFQAAIEHDVTIGDVSFEWEPQTPAGVDLMRIGRGTDMRFESSERAGAAERKYRKHVRRGLIDPDEELPE